MKSNNKIILALILFLVSFPLSVNAVILNWDTITLYDDLSLTVNRPNVYNGHVAYAGRYGDILYWDGIDTSIVSVGGGTSPSLHNGNIAWYGGIYDIYLWDGEQVSQLTNGNINGFPSVWDGTVAWQTGYAVAKDKNQDIYYFDGTMTHQITSTVGTEFYDGGVSLWAGQMAWVRGTLLGSQIMFWDGTNILELTSLSDDDCWPSLYKGKIAFSRGSGEDSHIMLWDGTTISEVVQFYSHYNVPVRVALWEDMIVWPGYDGQYTQIYLWDGSQVHQVTNNDKWHYDPDIYVSGNQIQIVYVETDNINENVLTQVIYAYATIPEPSQIACGFVGIMSLIFYLKRRRQAHNNPL